MRYLLFHILIFASLFSFGQDWAWMKGSNLQNQPAVYGIKNISSPTNVPGARGGAAGWKSNSGELWLFGGEGFSSTGLGRLNDLFKYNLSTNNWTWINGDTIADQKGIYGTIGISSASNKPGARSYSATWVDIAGNFWLFGGFGYDASGAFGNLNDLWKYNVSTNEWTWIKGSNAIDQNGQYGSIGVSNNLNCPGARMIMGTWTDGTGTLWLFGGNGFATFNNNGALNDLWKYNTATNQWTWVKGDSLANPPGVFGVKGVFSPANKPTGRPITTTWTDASGNLWFFGGFNNGGPWDDLWQYNPITNEWAWMKGNGSIYQNGVYGTMNVPSASNNPGSRSINIGWKDASGNFWLFGGYGLGATTSNIGYINDMWKYSPLSNDWVWQKGSSAINQPGNYGVQGISSPFNIPGARSNSTTWVDNNGDLWLFGSALWGSSFTNDLWKMSNPIITSINEDVDFEFLVYPNPATEKLYVKVEGTIQKCILIDMNGRIVFEGLVQSDEFSIDLNNFSNGIYTVKLTSTGNTFIKRINIIK